MKAKSNLVAAHLRIKSPAHGGAIHLRQCFSTAENAIQTVRLHFVINHQDPILH
jgi:hypothetical protein